MNIETIIKDFLKNKIEKKYMNPPKEIIEIESKQMLLAMLEHLYLEIEEQDNI